MDSLLGRHSVVLTSPTLATRKLPSPPGPPTLRPRVQTRSQQARGRTPAGCSPARAASLSGGGGDRRPLGPASTRCPGRAGTKLPGLHPRLSRPPTLPLPLRPRLSSTWGLERAASLSQPSCPAAVSEPPSPWGAWPVTSGDCGGLALGSGARRLERSGGKGRAPETLGVKPWRQRSGPRGCRL